MTALFEPGGEDDSEAGFVLLSVLLASMLFVAAGASLAVKSRLSAMQTANQAAAAKADALADGAALFAADALRPALQFSQRMAAAPPKGGAGDGAQPAAAPERKSALAVNGQALACPAPDGGRLELRAVDQGGLLDLNAAPVPMLRAFFAGAGIEGETARRLAEEVADFRDGDDDPQSTGMKESAQYAERGLPFGPRNAPFADPAEIGQLASATPAVVARLLPMLTVSNRKAGLDLAVMDGAARRALPREAADLPEIKRWLVPSEGTEFAVEARLRRADGSLAAGRRALVTFVGRQPGALTVRQWLRIGEDASARPLDGKGTPLCGALAKALAL